MILLMIVITGFSMLLQNTLANAPVETWALGREIVDYKLPKGYEEDEFLDFGNWKLLMIITPTRRQPPPPLIFIAELDHGLDISSTQLRRQVQRCMGEVIPGREITMTLAAEEHTTIRGQDVLLFVYDGEDDQGDPYHQLVTSLFDGKRGRVTVWIWGPEAQWDEARMRDFLTSIE